MRHAPTIVITLVLVASCSRSGRGANKAVATVEEPWGHAWSGASDGWWTRWDSSLGGRPPNYGVGTQFELETVGPNGARTIDTIAVREMKPHSVPGRFELVLESSKIDAPYAGVYVPPNLAYAWAGNFGHVTARNEKLVSVTVPAGTFAAGRLWRAEQVGGVSYERDEWVVPDIPFPIQSWSRPVSAKELYNPPADGTIPDGTSLTRLIRIERK